jgi:hypothetical protein
MSGQHVKEQTIFGRWVMNKLRMVVLVGLASAALTSLVLSQPGPLKGSSSFEVNVGFWNQIQAGQNLSVNGINQTAKTSGFVGGRTYCYWMRENFALTVAGSLLSAEATTDMYRFTIEGEPILNSTRQTANAVTSILIGMRYFLPQPEPEDRVRPFVAFGVGSYIGSEAENTLFSQSAHSESVIGGRVGCGLDALLGSWLKLNANVGYNLMADFKTPVGARNNFNGYDMSFGFGFVF